MPAPPLQPADADRELVAAAARKQRAGEKLSPAEAAALRRFRTAAEEADRWRYYASIPKGHWARMSGRQHKVLDEQASRYGLPILGKTIDLSAVARWLHEFLAANAAKLRPDNADDELLAGDSKWAERLRMERALLVRLERRQREGQLVDRDRTHQCWTRVAGVLHRCGEVLQRQYGPLALRLLNQALEDAQREVDSVFGVAHGQPDPADHRGGNAVLPEVGDDARDSQPPPVV
jgi:phage terminase Nu1 subunit (DNA packaging protein)